MQASPAPQYGLCVPAGSYLQTTAPFPIPSKDAMTWECVMKPPRLPRVAVWLLVHTRFAVGIFKGHVVLRVDTQVYITSTACATENTTNHWAGTFHTAQDVPLLFCNGEHSTSLDLLRLEQVDGLIHVDAAADLAEPCNSLDTFPLRIGWTSKPNRLRDAGVHLVVSELRLWYGALPLDTLSTWKLREVTHTHPYIAKLAAYWRLNNQSRVRYQLDSSGLGHDLHLLGFDDDVHWVQLLPVHVRAHIPPAVHLHFHQQPQTTTAPSSLHRQHMTFAVDIIADAVPTPSKSHIVLVLATPFASLSAQEVHRVALGMQQFIALVPSHTDVAIVTAQGSLLQWRRMDPLGKREATKVIQATLHATTTSTTTHVPSTQSTDSINHAMETAFELVAAECHHVANTSVFWSAAVVACDDVPAMPRWSDRLRYLWTLVQHVTRVSLISLTPNAVVENEPKSMGFDHHNVVAYSFAMDDIEWVLSDVLFKCMHVVCHSVRVEVVATANDVTDGKLKLTLSTKPYDVRAGRSTCTTAATSDMPSNIYTHSVHEHVMDIGVLTSSDHLHFSGSFDWTKPTGQSVEVHVSYIVCGSVRAATSYVAIPPYAMVQQLTEQRPCHEYTDIAAAATRTGARRADAMYQCRKAYLEHVEDMDTSNAQKQFEQLRSAKEVFSKQFQSISDDVVGFVHEMDIRTLVDECRTPQETPQKPPSAEKFAFQGTAVGDFAYDLSTRSTSRTEWVEPLALVHAKGCIDDADVEFAQAAKGLRLIDDDLKRTDNVFITAIEIDVQLAAWVSRLRETTRMRSDIAPLLLQHAIGAKSVLGRRMQDRRELRTATDVAEINRVVPELVGRLDARRGADDAAVERLEPVVAAEMAGFVQLQFAWAQARFTEVKRNQYIPPTLVPSATFVWCRCERPSVWNALQALVFALRTGRKRGQPDVPLCPPVHSHDRPLWLPDEQHLTMIDQMEGVADDKDEKDVMGGAPHKRNADAWQLCAQVLFITSSCTTDTVAVETAARDAKSMGKPMWHIRLDDGGGKGTMERPPVVPPISAATPCLPRPWNTVVLAALDTSFECDDCRTMSPQMLLLQPCYMCSFHRPATSADFAAFVDQVSEMLISQPSSTAPSSSFSPSSSCPSTHLPPPLFQLRKSHAERRWLQQKAKHVELANARASSVCQLHQHIFTRYDQDMEDLLSVQAQLGHWNQSTQQHRDRTVLSLNVQVTGLDVEMAAASARLVWLSDQLLCVEEDALGRIRQSSDVAVATGSLQPHRAGLAYLYDIGVLYPFVNAQWYATLQASMVQEAEIAFIKQLIALELTQATTVLACISTWQATVADMLKAYLRSPSTDAATLYRIALSSVMTFVPSAAPCNFDGDWLQRAVHDMQLHEKYCLDQMQDGFVQAKDLHSIETQLEQLYAAKQRFLDTYHVRSDVAPLCAVELPAAVLRDAAWTRPDPAMELGEAWESLHVMLARVQDQVVSRRKTYLHSQCCCLYLQSVVALAHKAWVNQCLAVLNATSAGLRAAVHALDETSGPRQDAERSFRSAKEDLASCRHKLRCCFEAHRRSHDMQLAIRDSMLHLRQILTTHTKVESVARLASLKTTKYLWDQLATYQSESFASVFEDASELESQMEQMSREQELLTVQVERAEGLVGAKEAAWKAAVWVHMGASVRVQRWQSSLHAVLHLVLDLETKRQRALELDLHLHAGVADDLHQNGGTIPAPIIADVLVVDSTLIESSMLRLELQKQTRLTQRSANRVRVLERMCRQETELLQIGQEEAIRKTKLNDLLVHRCRFLDRVLTQLNQVRKSYPPSDIPVANAFRTLHEHMHTASDASWRRCHAQAAAFAEENWLVQHRKNVVLAVQSLLTAAIDAHDGNKATLDDLVRTQLAMVDGIGSNPEQLAPKRPMDAMHLMLFLNASASATWARQVNLKRTVLQEAMYIKRTDKLEWFKVDPNCPEYVAARAAYFAAEGDLIVNRLDIKRADADADYSHQQCQQYILTRNADSVINHSAVHSFGSVNPAPALFDIPLMQLWGAFDSITIHKRVELERQLRHLALSVDLRAADVDVHEAILGGDLKSKDVAEVYGRPKRLAGGQFASLMASFVSAVRTAKFIRRLIAHKHAIQQKNQIFAAATDRLRDVQLLAALVAIPCKLLTHATVMTVIGPFLRDSRRHGAASTFARQLVCSTINWTLPRVVRWRDSILRHQALMRGLAGVVDAPSSAVDRKRMHSEFVAFALQHESYVPPHIDPDSVAIVVRPARSSTSHWTIEVFTVLLFIYFTVVDSCERASDNMYRLCKDVSQIFTNFYA
ncbi:hypothetical protein, variant 2 [Aphanomyces astaci]|uniref:Uncharacterized protein n=1 Tax=Aphanomyces astaci TaxID=112090 RepID=W4GE50_APHAT|nr:hypothetical protein, variant 2 [Aphanomyces astaci]ETV77950.1 hypothetical protein, variant 2 [Aphanomyces astaci]|eukprot:XP_009832285.1 hypothetical protein, variant 2 [Aphanomyces astaci]